MAIATSARRMGDPEAQGGAASDGRGALRDCGDEIEHSDALGAAIVGSIGTPMNRLTAHRRRQYASGRAR